MSKLIGLRFIIGSGCNYNCFYCHHEGYEKEEALPFESFKEKIDKLYEYCLINEVYNISVTGGEPFIYWEKLKYLIETFNKKNFKMIINTNFSLVNLYFEELKKLKNIEFHINLSSLDQDNHRNIVKTSILETVLNNLEKVKEMDHKICLNIPIIKSINEQEMISLLNYCNSKGFYPRFLILYANDQYKISIPEFLELIPTSKIQKKHSYGIYDVTSDFGNFEIVQCLCTEKECDVCKENTYLHLTPNLNIKYCMEISDEVEINFNSNQKIDESFNEANEKLRRL